MMHESLTPQKGNLPISLGKSLGSNDIRQLQFSIPEIYSAFQQRFQIGKIKNPSP